MPLTRRHFLTTSTAALAAGTLGRVEFFAKVAPVQGAQPPAPVTPVFKELRRNTGYWTARGGTIGWLINPSGVITVDSQFPDTAALCVEQLLKISGKPDIAALINSHHHGDHTGGNGVFRPKTKQIVAAIICILNEQRKLFKLKPLKPSKKLTKSAVGHTGNRSTRRPGTRSC